VSLASSLSHCRPLARYPGWRFGIEEDSPTNRLIVRLRLWEYFKKHSIDRPVRVEWVDGISLDVVLGNDLSRSLYVGGSIEPNEFFFVGKYLRQSMVAVDAGANEGWFSAFMARRVGDHGLVIAVEPSAREVLRLKRNLLINGLRNLRVVTDGLSDFEGRAVLHVAGPEHSGQNTLGEFVYSGVSGAHDEEIQLRRLDMLVADLSRPIDLIKMDVEGAELAVLRGAEKVLRESRPVILFEMLDAALRAQNSSALELMDFFAQRKYSVLRFQADGTLAPLRCLDDASSNLVASPEGRQAELIALSHA
jgi:FkbM family methyltransferase